MSDMKDFVIENGVLIKYVGTGGDVIIPEDVSAIGKIWGEGPFDGCKKVTSVQLNQGLNMIGFNAFKGCSGIENIVIPNTVDTVLNNAFDGCSKLETIEFASDCNANISCTGCKMLTYIRGNESLIERILKCVSANQKIRLCYGYLNSNDTNAEYEKSAKKLKNKLFDLILADDNSNAASRFLNCYSKPLSINDIDELLKLAKGKASVTAALLEYKEKNYSKKKITKNASNNIDKELGLKEKTLAEWRKVFALSIEKDEIAICKYKQKEKVVIIPDVISKKPVTWIQDAFRCCDFITEVVLPDTVKSIGWSTFEDCTKLKKVRLSENLTEIGDFCFYGCKALKHLYIPASVKRINDAFEEDSKITIHAPAGSYAEQYAKENKIPFVAE